MGGNVWLDLSYATIPVNGREVKLYREPRASIVVERIDPSQMTFFCDVDLGNFIVEITNSLLRSTNPMVDEVQNEKN